MPVVIPVHHDAVSVIQQCAPAEYRDVDAPLKGPGKRGKTGTFKDHGAHFRMALEKPHPGLDKIMFGSAVHGRRRIGAVIPAPQMVKLGAAVVIHGPGNHIALIRVYSHGAKVCIA